MNFRGFALPLLMGALLACPGRAETIPVPRMKPARNAEADAIPTALIPVPRPNPRRNKSAAAQPDWPGNAEGWPAAVVAEARAACRQQLAGLGISYEPLAPIGKEGGCGTPAPISLSAIAGVAFAPAATMNCDLARSLHDWITGSVQPAAQRRLKTSVTGVNVAASYVCRRRNNQSGGKLSEHGRANALDMSGFSFSRSDTVAVEGGWGAGILKSIGLSRGGSFLGDIRKDACQNFTTVLGPGSDRYHGDHFHVDVLQRRGDYRICK